MFQTVACLIILWEQDKGNSFGMVFMLLLILSFASQSNN